LAVALAHCFNEVRCSPPLPSQQVTAIADAVAISEIEKAEQRHG